MKELEKLKENGTFKKDGKTYILIEAAQLSDNCYESVAICEQDEMDEDGYYPAYSVEWEIINYNMDDESDNCDWENPSDVTKVGEYNPKTRRMY